MVATESNGTKWSIEKFDGVNFHLWKFKMQMVLEEKGLYYCVQEGVEKNSNSAEKAADRKALATICLALGDSQLMHVRNASCANEAWTKLEKNFEMTGLANAIFLRRRFYTSVMGESGTVMGHIAELNALVQQLEAASITIDEKDLVMTLLGSLPAKFDNLITSLESIDTEDLSMAFVTARLLHEEAKFLSHDAVDEKVFQAKFHEKKKKFTVKCFICDEVGHFARDHKKFMENKNEKEEEKFCN